MSLETVLLAFRPAIDVTAIIHAAIHRKSLFFFIVYKLLVNELIARTFPAFFSLCYLFMFHHLFVPNDSERECLTAYKYNAVNREHFFSHYAVRHSKHPKKSTYTLYV